MVDELEEARRLCYGPDRHKVVSVDGTMFKPNGTFTGLFDAGPGHGCHSYACSFGMNMQHH